MKRRIAREDLPFPAMDAADRLGNLVSIARRQRLWTQADLAAKADISLSTVLDIEKGSPSVQLGLWLKALWALDQTDRLIKFAQPSADEEGVGMMVQQLPKRVRSIKSPRP